MWHIKKIKHGKTCEHNKEVIDLLVRQYVVDFSEPGE